MNDIYEALKRLAAEPEGRGVLVEITATAGSSPRKAGARMLLLTDGTTAGTVGGGSLEHRAGQDARAVLHSGAPLRKTYSLGAAPGEDIGAICGGSATLDFRVIGPADAAALLAAQPVPPRVLLYGAGHVGKALADALHLLDIPVVVSDAREGLLTPERFPYAERRLAESDSLSMEPQALDRIVIMTHSHALDYDLLRRALRTDAAYIGVMASRRKSALFRERLAEEGVPAEQFDRRVHCPIGLAIGAETPEEIAVSIAAELIAFERIPKA